MHVCAYCERLCARHECECKHAATHTPTRTHRLMLLKGHNKHIHCLLFAMPCPWKQGSKALPRRAQSIRAGIRLCIAGGRNKFNGVPPSCCVLMVYGSGCRCRLWAGVGGLVLAAGGCRWVVVNLWWLFLLFLLIVFVFVRCCS